MNNYKYIMFPIQFLQFYPYNKEEKLKKLEHIRNWAIMNFLDLANKNNKKNIARQVFYDYLRNRESINYQLKMQVRAMITQKKIPRPDKKRFFYGDEFNANKAIEPIIERMTCEDNFYMHCFNHYLKHMIKSNLGIKYDSEDLFALSINYLNHNTDLVANSPRASIKYEWIIDTINGKIPLELFRMICAIRSIVGKKKFAITNRKMIVSRMFGLRSSKFTYNLGKKESEQYSYYTKRYPFDKLMNNAADRGFFAKIPAHRGYYISKELTTDELATKVKTSIQKKQDKRKREKAASLSIKNKLSNYSP
jgi:hypothetical protein